MESIIEITADTKNVIFTKKDKKTLGNPNCIEIGDIVIYGDYEYRYGMCYYINTSNWIKSGYKDGWGVRVLNIHKFSYSTICDYIYGKPVETLEATFYKCHNLVSFTKIPKTVKDMRLTFFGCSNLMNVPEIPNGVTDISFCFKWCENLRNAPNIPSSVVYMWQTFCGCLNLTGRVIVDSYELRNSHGCYMHTRYPIVIVGNLECLTKIAAQYENVSVEEKSSNIIKNTI